MERQGPAGAASAPGLVSSGIKAGPLGARVRCPWPFTKLLENGLLVEPGEQSDQNPSTRSPGGAGPSSG